MHTPLTQLPRPEQSNCWETGGTAKAVVKSGCAHATERAARHVPQGRRHKAHATMHTPQSQCAPEERGATDEERGVAADRAVLLLATDAPEAGQAVARPVVAIALTRARPRACAQRAIMPVPALLASARVIDARAVA